MREKHAYIRPVHPKGGGPLKSLALCRSDDILLQDSCIIDHFPPDTPGKDIAELAVEFGHASHVDNVHWAGCIFAGDRIEPEPAPVVPRSAYRWR